MKTSRDKTNVVEDKAAFIKYDHRYLFFVSKVYEYWCLSMFGYRIDEVGKDLILLR